MIIYQKDDLIRVKATGEKGSVIEHNQLSELIEVFIDVGDDMEEYEEFYVDEIEKI